MSHPNVAAGGWLVDGAFDEVEPGDGVVAAGSAAGEQASSRPERAISAHTARGMDMTPETSGDACYLGPVDRFVLPAAASVVVGLLLGAAAVFGLTLMVQQDTKPPVQAGDPASSVLNRVEYGDRG
jgi:hypothetical protein